MCFIVRGWSAGRGAAGQECCADVALSSSDDDNRASGFRKISKAAGARAAASPAEAVASAGAVSGMTDGAVGCEKDEFQQHST